MDGIMEISTNIDNSVSLIPLFLPQTNGLH